MKIYTCTFLSTLMTFFNPVRSSAGQPELYGSPTNLDTLRNVQPPIGTPVRKSNAGYGQLSSSPSGSPTSGTYTLFPPDTRTPRYQQNTGSGVLSSIPYGSPHSGTFTLFAHDTRTPGYQHTTGSSTEPSHLHGSAANLGTLRNVQDPIRSPLRKSNADLKAALSFTATNQGPNFAQKEYEKPPKAKRLHGDWCSVAGMEGKLFFGWFLPKHPTTLLPRLDPAKAARLRIRILTPASLNARPMKVQVGDFLFRGAVKIGIFLDIGEKNTAAKWVSTNTAGKGVIAPKVTPSEYDVLVRGKIPYAQYHDGSFYAYDPEPDKFPYPEGANSRWRIK